MKKTGDVRVALSVVLVVVKLTRTIDDHGSCVHCGVDLNGVSIWRMGMYLKEGDEEEADKYAEAYGARKGWGKFGREIYVKSYDENYNKLPAYFKCPDCGEKCYE